MSFGGVFRRAVFDRRLIVGFWFVTVTGAPGQGRIVGRGRHSRKQNGSGICLPMLRAHVQLLLVTDLLG